MKFFFSWVSQSRALNKEQCPIYWRVVLMMIRLALCSLNVVGMYLKFDFRCWCTICFFVVWLCPVPICTCYRPRVGWFTVVSWRNNNYTLCARDIFLLVSLFGFKLNILAKQLTLALLEKKIIKVWKWRENFLTTRFCV